MIKLCDLGMKYTKRKSKGETQKNKIGTEKVKDERGRREVESSKK